MTRHLWAAAESAAAAPQLQYRALVDIGVTSSTLYICNGNMFLTASMTNMHSANTYSPIGNLGGIEAVEDESDTSPKTVRLWMRAVNSSDFYEPNREDMFNRPVTIRRAFLDPILDTLVSTPEITWKGFINKVELHFADVEKGNYFEIEAESALRRRAEAVNFNGETLKTVLAQSGDTFFDYLHLIPLTKALWGNQPTAFNGVSPHFGSITLASFYHNLRKKP